MGLLNHCLNCLHSWTACLNCLHTYSILKRNISVRAVFIFTCKTIHVPVIIQCLNIFLSKCPITLASFSVKIQFGTGRRLLTDQAINGPHLVGQEISNPVRRPCENSGPRTEFWTDWLVDLWSTKNCNNPRNSELECNRMRTVFVRQIKNGTKEILFLKLILDLYWSQTSFVSQRLTKSKPFKNKR